MTRRRRARQVLPYLRSRTAALGSGEVTCGLRVAYFPTSCRRPSAVGHVVVHVYFV